MLSENIKTLRKQKGYSQEQLADKLNVVRQTVSKWEKGYSVPDADMLEDMADIFEVQVSELLGGEIITEEETSDIDELAKQLRIFNEYLAERVRRRKKALIYTKKCLLSLLIIALISTTIIFAIEAGDMIKHKVLAADEKKIEILCSLDDKEYTFDIHYSDNGYSAGGFGQIKELYNIVFGDMATMTEEDAAAMTYEEKINDILYRTEEYFISRGGTCEIIFLDRTTE